MKTLLTTAAAIVAFGGAAYAQSIDAHNTTAREDSVTIPSVTMTEPGFVTIHTIKDNVIQAPEAIGSKMVKEGTTKNVTVDVNYAFQVGETYAVVLNADTNGNGRFDPTKDKAIQVDGKVVSAPFVVKSLEAAPAGAQ